MLSYQQVFAGAPSTYEGHDNSRISVGPWGGQGGALWDDGVYNTVRQVVICHGATIDSIQFEYDKRGSSVWSEKHGGTGCLKTNTIMLDYPDEYLVSISGHCSCLMEYGPVIVRSLMFESNKKKYGPFGIQYGTYFSIPLNGGKIVGFHGRSSWYLDSIGVHLIPLLQPNPSSNFNTQKNYITKGINEKYRLDFNDHLEEELITKVVISRQEINPVGSMTRKQPVSYGHYGGNADQSQKVASMNNDREIHIIYVVADVGLDTPNPTSISVGISSTQEINPVGSATSTKQAVSYGPWGGNGGYMFDDGVYAGVREVHLTRAGGVVSMRVCYDLNGQAVWGNKNGGTGGIRLDKIAFDYPSEILTQITGYYGSTILRGPTVVKSLTFHTNRRKYGPFGDEQGISFSSGSNKGIILGFHGRKGWFLDSIGVHVLEGTLPISRPISRPSPEGTIPAMVKEASPLASGPWGGRGGNPWDDGVFCGVKEIFLTKGKGEAIYCIQIKYDRNDHSVWSVRHGGGSGSGSEGSSHTIKFEYPYEILTSVSGYYGSLSGDEQGGKGGVIKSLTFYTNRAKYGPYGEETGTYFSSSTKTDHDGKIVGFHGGSGCCLNAIGVYVQQCSNELTQQGFGGRGGPVKMLTTKFFK